MAGYLPPAKSFPPSPSQEEANSGTVLSGSTTKRRKRRIWLWILGTLALLLAAAGGGVYWSLRSVRPFYRDALALPKEMLVEKNRDFLNRTSKFSNDLRKPGRWTLLLTDEQLNGWLAVDLAENHPNALPPEVRDPRVKITAGSASGGVTVERNPFPVAASLDVSVRLVDPQTIAVRIMGARLGTLPWTLDRVVVQLTKAAQDQGWEVRQSMIDTDPVLTLTLPERFNTDKGRVTLEALEFREGELYLAGRTEIGPE